MPRHLLPLAALGLALSACGVPPFSTDPVAAELTRTQLTVKLQNGHTCRIARAGATRDDAEGWGGRITGCPGVSEVDVTFQPRPEPPLGIIPALIAALSLDGVFAQYAEVTLTGPEGRSFVFSSPPPPEDTD